MTANNHIPKKPLLPGEGICSILLLSACLLFSFVANAQCPQSNPEQVARESSAALNTLFERERANAGGDVSRNLSIVSVALAAEGKLDARVVQYLSQYVEAHPGDQFAKLYEGYAWVFSAGEYNRRKNYLRAAEDVKRGFFLIDEAVDSAPGNWRLRYLRLRMDAFVSADLGRYVIALKDVSILTEMQDQLPPALHSLIQVLHAAALERAGKTQAADTCGLQAILSYALEHAP